MKAITKSDAQTLYNKYQDEYHIEFGKGKCACGETQTIDIINYRFGRMVSVPICDNCADRFGINEAVMTIDSKLETKQTLKTSPCCSSIILKTQDNEYICSKCLERVDEEVCPFCDSDGEIRTRHGFIKCTECAGTKRIQL